MKKSGVIDTTLHCGEDLRLLAGRHDADESSSLDRRWFLREDGVTDRICAMKVRVVALMQQSAVLRRLCTGEKVGCRRAALLLKTNEFAAEATKGRPGGCADFNLDGTVRSDGAGLYHLSLECRDKLAASSASMDSHRLRISHSVSQVLLPSRILCKRRGLREAVWRYCDRSRRFDSARRALLGGVVQMS